jgi:O-antigen ligase
MAFYLYLFSLPFEIPERSIPMEVHTLTGALLLASALIFQPRACFSRPPAAFWPFAVYLCVYVSFGVFSNHEQQWIRDSITVMLGVLLFWFTSNLLRHATLAMSALVTVVASCCLLALLQRLGVTSGIAESGELAERMTALGQNPNLFANNMSLAFLMLVGLAYGMAARLFPSILIWPFAALLVVVIMPTAARGALIALVVGLPIVLFPRGGVAAVTRNSVVVAMLLAGVVGGVYRADGMRNRLLAAEEGDLAQRENLYPAAWQMFLEKPILGWGPVNNRYELERHVPRVELPYRETHNLVLELLTETGLVGAIPFLAALVLCLRAAWRDRGGPLGLVPLALMLSVLLSKMGSAWMGSKMHWLVFALAAAGDLRRRAGGTAVRRVSGARRANGALLRWSDDPSAAVSPAK